MTKQDKKDMNLLFTYLRAYIIEYNKYNICLLSKDEDNEIIEKINNIANKHELLIHKLW